MLLSDWIRREGITRRTFAARIGATPTMITDWCSGKYWPSRPMALAIEQETQGEVTAADFVHLGTAAEPERAA